MTLQLESGLTAALDHSEQWNTAFVGKTIRGVRPTHDNGPVPDVNILFTDDTAVTISVKPGVYFEGCLINTLRKAQPTTGVIVTPLGFGSYCIEVRSRTFPLLQLLATVKEGDLEDFPFVLVERPKAHG